MAGNVYEKTTIFSLIVLIVFAVVFVSFVSNTDGKSVARYRERIRRAACHPLFRELFTTHPVCVWDSKNSFRKFVFSLNGILSCSPVVTEHGLDPKVEPIGSWTLTPEGSLRLSFKSAGVKEYVCISPAGGSSPLLMRQGANSSELWFFGENSLAEAQICCFGWAGATSGTGFTESLLVGKTVYWATYPGLLPAASDEVVLNPELAYGVIVFHEDGTLSKSKNNVLGAEPDYSQAFKGNWRIAGKGVLHLTVGLHSTEVTLLLPEQRHSLLTGSPFGSEMWFLDEETAARQLEGYLAAIALEFDKEIPSE